MNTPTNPYDDAPLLDLRKIVATLWSRRWLLAAGFFLGAVAGVIVVLVSTPIYRGAAVLAPVRINQIDGLGGALGQLGGLASVVGLDLQGGGADTEEALAVLRSREFSERFIGERGLLPRFYPDDWDAANKQWKVPPDRQPTLGQAFKYFNKSIRNVTQDRKTGLVTLSIDWENRNEAAAWANEIVNRVNAEMRGRAIANANASVTYLEKELETTTTVATREAISRLMEAQIKQRMVANVTQEYAFRIVDRAMPAEPEDVVRPRKIRWTAGFAMGGFALAAFWILISSSLRGATEPRMRATP